MRKFIYGVVGLAIGITIFIILLSQVPQPIVAKSNLFEFENYKENRNIPAFYEEIPLLQFNSYHVRAGSLENYKKSKVVIYGRVNPMWYWEREIPEELENENNMEDIDGEKQEFDWKDNNGFITQNGNTLGYNMNTGKLEEIEIKNIQTMILEKGKLPVLKDLYSVSSSFGPRKDPFNKDITTFHVGLDIAHEKIEGREVMAVFPGVISKVSTNKGYGNYMIINHGEFATLYAHLEGFARNIEAGTEVLAGDVIGYVGSTGRSTGPHLHLEFDVDGVKIDPEPFMNILTGEEKLDYIEEDNNEYNFGN